MPSPTATKTRWAAPALAAATLFGLSRNAAAQGCVAARCPANLSPSTLSLHGLPGEDMTPHSGWQATIAYRWLKSDRHFVGTHEEKQRQAEGSEVINDSDFIDFSLTYAFNSRLSATLTIPYVDHDRSSVVRNSQRAILERFHVQSRGIGDIRLSGNYWLWDPAGHPGGGAAPSSGGGKGEVPAAPAPAARRGNVLVSVGIDMPTGDESVSDTHRRFNTTTGTVVDIERNVDQSIQPGDGGWGIPIDVYAYYSFTDRLSGYLSGSYLITPEEKNGVLTGRGNPFEAEMSIADTFAARAGFEYALFPRQGVSVSLGLRMEGVPVHDLMGGSDGFRRPGMAISVEPGISWMKNGWSASLTVPIAFYRERFQSVPDMQQQAATGNPQHGDAAFADYLVMFAVGRQF